MKKVHRNTPLVVLTLFLLIGGLCQAEIIEESGSLLEFFAGQEDNCAYDNWVSHVSEGIVRPAYNDYGPVELDRQTNGFGNYQIVDSLQNPNEIIQDWYTIFANILAGEVDTAAAILDSSAFAELFEIVVLQDRNERYVMVREVLDNNYFDDNGTENEADDVRGSFRYGWGLYIFNLNARTPEVILEIPHPCDDFITPFIGIDAFISMGASAMFVAGAGRELRWTEVGVYDNSRSRSDPTRVGNRSAFNEAHNACVDSIADELVIPIHSYDSGGRDLGQCLISCYPDNHPDSPVIDRVNHFDFLHLTPLYPIAANSIGNADHNAVRIDDYYSVWDDQGGIYYNYEYPISNNLANLVGWLSPQRSYSTDHRDPLSTNENYMHVEHDEFPDVITEEILDFYPPDGVPTYQTYANSVEFYRPLYNAVYSYYHRPRFFRVPDDYETIQAAIDGSLGGDTILVRPGEYTESINYRHKNLLIASLFLPTNDARYIDSTRILGVNSSVVTFAGSESESAKLVGFTIRGGRSLDGAGIFMTDAKPVIDHCIITDNIAEGYGGGMFCGNSQPTITNCTISRNISSDGGGALFEWNLSSAIILNSIMTGNEPQEVYFLRFGAPNRITFAYSDIAGGAEGIVTGNNGIVGWGDGNITANPQFIDPANSNFHLSPFSPCVNTGNPNAPLDPDSTRSDMGALAIQFKNIFVSPDVIEFADVQPGRIDSLLVSIHNVGNDSISILSWHIAPEHSPFRMSGYDGDTLLEPASQQSAWIVFTPEASELYRAVLTIESSQPGQEVIVVSLRGSSLGAPDSEAEITDFRLLSVYPNPFNSKTTITFTVQQASQPVRLTIYDLSGRLVADLLDRRRGLSYGAGDHKVVWDAGDLGAGVYFVRLNADEKSSLQKVLLVR